MYVHNISHGLFIELSLDFVVCMCKMACYEIRIVSHASGVR